jgi:hypothetical protein
LSISNLGLPASISTNPLSLSVLFQTCINSPGVMIKMPALNDSESLGDRPGGLYL